MLRIAICDDEQVFLEEEEKLIRQCLIDRDIPCEIYLFDSASKILLSEVEEYDIIFLDMAMPDMGGIEVAKRLREKGVRAEIVFVTAFIEYSPDGYTVGAFRYILKDIMMKSSMVVEECIDAFLSKYNVRYHEIEFELETGHKKINSGNLVRIEVFHRDVYLWVMENNILEKYKLKGRHKLSEFEWLSEYHIISVHKSFMVNLDYVADIERYRAILSIEGQSVEIAQKKYINVRSIYVNYKGGTL